MPGSPSSENRNSDCDVFPTDARVDDIVKVMRDAWYTRRQIVPLVGAGLSADSGFPIVTVIMRYLAKFREFLRYGGYLSANTFDYRSDKPEDNDLIKSDPLRSDNLRYQTKPWTFVDDFGWPERFQLDQELLRIYEKRSPNQERMDEYIEARVRESLQKDVAKFNSNGVWQYEKLRDVMLDEYPGDKTKIKPWFEESDDGRSRYWDILGDWKKIIQYYTNFQTDYVDALIAKYSTNRKPNSGHRFLAHLTRLLNVRILMTYNFDNLIEDSLRFEGIDPKVFSMPSGTGLPHPSLFRESTCVVKLHGTNHDILMDESVDHPLTDDYKTRFMGIVGDDPLLLVVGCSGSDYRLQDLVRHLVTLRVDADEKAAEAAKRTGKPEPGTTDGKPGRPRPCIIWLGFDKEPPTFLHDIHGAKERVLYRSTIYPAATLQHIHSGITGRHPASEVPYISHIERPFTEGGLPDKEHKRIKKELKAAADAKKPFLLYSTLGPAQSDGFSPEHYASHSLLDLAKYKVKTNFHIIWVDLESHSTLAGVVGSIIDQCRRYDSDLAPCVLPLDSDEDVRKQIVERAVERVAHALQRAKYFVAIDSLQTYDSQILTHDGTSHISQLTTKKRYAELQSFLEKLAGAQLGESHLGLSVDNPWPRHESKLKTEGGGHDGGAVTKDDDGPTPIMRKLMTQVTETVAAISRGYHKVDLLSQRTDENPKLSELFPDRVEAEWSGTSHSYPLASPGAWYNQRLLQVKGEPQVTMSRYALVFLLLTTVRRTRTHAGMRWLLEPVCGQDGQDIDTFVNFITGPDARLGILRMEGGGCWYDRRIRDHIYHCNTSYAGTDKICTLLRELLTVVGREKNGIGMDTRIRKTVFQLIANVTAHQLASRGYYSRAYLPSGDTFNFLEYLYHRVSCIRYLCKLVAIIQKISDVSKQLDGATVLKALRDGLADFGTFIRRSTSDGGTIFFERIRMRADVDDNSRESDKTEQSDKDRQSDKAEQLLMQIFDDQDCIRCDYETVERLSRLPPTDPLRKEEESETRFRDSLDLLLMAFKFRHKNEIEGLIRSWELAEADLRTKLPAEQLLQLCDHMLEDELVFRLNSVAVGYETSVEKPDGDLTTIGEPTEYSNKQTAHTTNDKKKLWAYLLKMSGETTDVNTGVSELVRVFGTRVKAFRERVTLDRTDYKAVLRYMTKNDDNSVDREAEKWVDATLGYYLQKAIPERQSKLVEPAMSNIVEHNIAVVQRVLDMVVCLMKIYQHNLSNAGLEKFMVSVDALLNALRKQIKSVEERLTESIDGVPMEPVPPATTHCMAQLFDARMRIMNLLTEAAFGRTSVFANCGFDGSAKQMRDIHKKPKTYEHSSTVSDKVTTDDGKSGRKPKDDPFPQPLTENPVRAEVLLLDLRAQIRYTPPHRVHEPRSMIIDPTPGGVLYEPYRSITHMYAGKLNWLQCYRDGTFRRAKFESAFRDFDLARSALGDSNPLVRTLVELHSVECCLAYSRIVLHPGFNAEQLEVQPDRLPSMVESKLETARTSLRRAQSYLGQYRRNVLWWRGYYHLVAQYHAERILCGLAEMLFLAGSEGDAQRGPRQMWRMRLLGTRLRRAYAGLRTLFDYNLKDELRDQSAWSIRAWYEMTLAVYAAGTSIARESHNPNIHDYVIRQLQWLNLCAGLHHTGVQNAQRNTLERPSQNLWQLVTDQNLKDFEGQVLRDVKLDGVKNVLQAPLLRRQAVILATGNAVNKLFREIRTK